MLPQEAVEAEQLALSVLLGDDAQKLQFETKLYLTELRDEEAGQMRAEWAHIAWRTGRLRSAHQEVDHEVHKCGNQASALARALSGPRFAAAEDERYGEPMRVLDDMDGQRRKLQNVEEWRKKLVDLRALLDFIANECELTTGQKLLILSGATDVQEATESLEHHSLRQVPRGPSEKFDKSKNALNKLKKGTIAQPAVKKGVAAPDAVKKQASARVTRAVLQVYFQLSRVVEPDHTCVSRKTHPLSSKDLEER